MRFRVFIAGAKIVKVKQQKLVYAGFVKQRFVTREMPIIGIVDAFGVEELPDVCFASASIRKTKTTFSALGKIAYKPGGAKAWIAESNAILHPSE